MQKPLTPFAKQLRRDATPAETLLWHQLRNRQLGGHKFRRQQPIGPYIVDFVCPELKLVVELDGGQHAETHSRDQARIAYLESSGFTVLRFWNNAVFENLEGVLTVIADFTPPPNPSRKGRGALIVQTRKVCEASQRKKTGATIWRERLIMTALL